MQTGQETRVLDRLLGLIRQGEQPISSDQLRVLEALAPHIDDSVSITDGFTIRPALGRVLGDYLNIAVIVLDASARPVAMNPLGRDLLERDCPLYAHNGRIHAGTNVNLERAIKALIQGPVEQRAMAFQILRTPPARPLNAILTRPASSLTRVRKDGTAATLMVSDPDTLPHSAGDVIRRQYALTESETAFVLAFLQAQGLQAAADVLGISHETGRRHLKSVFQKTDTHTQVELTHLLLRHPAMMLTLPG